MSTSPDKEEPMEVEAEPESKEPESKEPESKEPPAAEEDPPAAAPPAAAAPEEKADEDAAAKDAAKKLQERQLVEFNQWLYRWNNYQQTLANYWQGRYFQLSLEMGGGKASKKGKKGKKGGGRTGAPKAEGKWDLRFQELVDFKEEHGHVNVPKEYTYKFSPPLGHWVGRMRHLHKKGTLDAARTARLESIDFQFIVERKGNMVNFSVVWDRSYRALKAFRDVNGHVEVPNGYKPQPDMAELDGWITRQRKHHRDGRLPEHLQSKLKELGLNLQGRGRPFGVESADMFGKNYKALAEYAEVHGDCDVPEKYDENRELGNWVKAQRDMYSDGMIPDDRVQLLQKIGFNFYHGRKTKGSRGTVSDPWQRRLAELKAYREKAGDTDVPKKFALNLGLGEFVYNQRMAYKEDKLSEEKIKNLKELGFDFELKAPPRKRKRGKTKWELRFDELVEFKEKHGHLNIPPVYGPNPSLGPWIRRQIKYKREGIMKDPKYERLKAIGVDFGGPKQEKKPWMEQYQSLVEFNKEHGHNDVPVHYKPNPPLYYWLGTQRQTYKKGKLAADKVALLEKIDFNFSIKLRGERASKSGTRGGNKPFLDPEEFDKLVGELNDYKEEHGHIDVPQREGRLGSFVHYMRFYAKGGKLAQGQIDSLNELGFSWNVTSDRWNAKFEMLSKFKEKRGHFDVPSGHACYAWVGYQRKLYQDDKLAEDRVEMLNGIDFDFAIPVPTRGVKETPAQWDEKYQDLVAFHKEHGHCKVPADYEASPGLAKWILSQQRKYKKGTLSDNCVDRLNEIKFNYLPDTLPKLGVVKIPKLEPVDRESYLENLWDKSYQELAKYKEEVGHCSIPISYEPNPSLGAWAFSQKMAYKKGKLTQDRFDKLNELGFPFGPPAKVVAEV